MEPAAEAEEDDEEEGSSKDAGDNENENDESSSSRTVLKKDNAEFSVRVEKDRSNRFVARHQLLEIHVGFFSIRFQRAVPLTLPVIFHFRFDYLLQQTEIFAHFMQNSQSSTKTAGGKPKGRPRKDKGDKKQLAVTGE